MTEIRELNPGQVFETCSERMEDSAIRTRLEELVQGIEMPRGGVEGPITPFAPYLATPNRAVRFVMEQVAGTGLTPVLYAYKSDKFASLNEEKAACTNPRLDFLRLTRNGVQRIIEGVKLVQVPARLEGAPIGSLQTIYEGKDLGTFFDELCDLLIPKLKVFDVSKVLEELASLDKGSGTKLSEKYYLFVQAINQVFGPGVNIGGNEDPVFYRSVVRPALLKAARILGVEPISLNVGEVPTGKEARIIQIDLRNIVELEQIMGLERSQ